MQPAQRPSLLQRALGVFVASALFLGLFLWAGKTLINRNVEGVYLDARRLAALQSFERALVPLKSVRGYVDPGAEAIQAQFSFCAEAFKAQSRDKLSNRARRANPCAGSGAAEELACHLKMVNARLKDMSTPRPDAERVLSERYVVDVERWAGVVREKAVPCRDAVAAARQFAARDGRLLNLVAWREFSARSVVASQFAPDQAVKVSRRILEQRNPWGGVPGCIYYGDAAKNGKLLYVTDRRQSNRQACVAMRPKETDEKLVSGVVARSAIARRAAGDPAQEPPESLDVVLAELDHIRLPWKDLFRAYTEPPAAAGEEPRATPLDVPASEGKRVALSHGPNQLDRQRHKVDAGFNVHLTIDPDTQRVVQQTSRCYAGDAASCRQLGIAADKKFDDYTNLMYEKAAVRMAAVALIDVASGRIEALGSAHSDCYRQEYDGPGRKARECPDLPTAPRYEPDRLLNHALYTDALPGSMVKPIMATGFLRDPAYRKKILADRVAKEFVRLQDELKGSDSVAFLNRMFCMDKGWTNCERPRAVQQAALLYGWDAGCDDASFRCGRLNVLFGYPDASRIRADTTRMPLGASVLYGRILVEPPSPKRPADFQLVSNFSFDPAHAAACSRGDNYSGPAEKRGWRKCKQGHLLYLESEGWGQGNARTTAVGAAGMIARLAAAANGQAGQRLPYLVERVTDAKGETFELAAQQFRLGDPVPLEIPQADAALIVQGMISHKSAGAPAGTRSGTAHSACIRVYDTAACNRIDWIAGKTGTPPYGNDGLTLKEIRQKCGAVPAPNASFGEKQAWWTSCSREQPYKWYIAAFKTDAAQTGFNKVIAVLTERNWYKSGPLAGKVQAPGDREMNISAEMAFRIMARLRSDPGN